MKLRMISRLFQFLCLAGAVFGRTEPDLSLWKDLTEALWVGRISFPCIDPSGIEQGTSSAAGADAGIFSPDSFQDVGYAHVRIPSSESLAVLQPEDQPEVSGLPAVIEETVVTDLLEPGREHMHQVSAYELCVFQGNGPSWISRLFRSG